MNRRKFVTTAAAGAAAATFSAPAISQNRQTWRMVTTWPKNLPGLGTGAQYFADQVTKCSGGRLTVQLFASGEIVPAFESIDAVGNGTVEMGHGAPYYWKGKSPATEFLANFPFGLTAQEYNAWYYFGDGAKLADEVYRAELNCKFLPCGNTGVQHPGWSRKPLKTLADFQGLKARMPGIGGEILKQMGATVVNLPGSEVAAALASGAVDLVEWNNPYGEASMGFYRHAKYYINPGWHEPGTVLELFINQKKWDALAPDLKAIVEQCAAATNLVMLSEFQARSGPVLQSYIKEHGVIINDLSDEILTKIGNISGTVIADLIKANKSAEKVYRSMMKFRDHQMVYTNAADTAFVKARSLGYKLP